MSDAVNLNGARLLEWSELQQASDNDLLHQLTLGNDDAFAIIVDRYQRLIYSVAYKLVKDEGEAEDVVQIVFLDVFRKKGLFDPSKGTLKMWLLQYAYTRSINRRYHLQHRYFYSRLNVEEINPLALSTERAADRWLTATEAARYLAQAFALLSSKQRKAIELISIKGMTFVEAAEEAGESLPATRHNYYRGMVKLRDILLPRTKPEEQGIRVSATAPIRLEVANLQP
jgi:RNA polymerase sigma-70 factor, ECF subfamily